MKKNIAALLVFMFTMQVVSPSFAQNNAAVQIQALNHCVDQITQNGEVFKTDVGLGENFNRLNVIKGLLFFTNNESFQKYLSFRAIKNTFNGGTGSLLTLFLAVEIPSYVACSWIEKMSLSEAIRFWKPLIISDIAFIIILHFGKNYFYQPLVNQNNHQISLGSLLNSQTELDINAQLTSESASARKILSDTVQGCEKILSEIKTYEQNPKLLEQELQKNGM